jgi:hypothetical protein
LFPWYLIQVQTIKKFSKVPQPEEASFVKNLSTSSQGNYVFTIASIIFRSGSDVLVKHHETRFDQTKNSQAQLTFLCHSTIQQARSTIFIFCQLLFGSAITISL